MSWKFGLIIKQYILKYRISFSLAFLAFWPYILIFPLGLVRFLFLDNGPYVFEYEIDTVFYFHLPENNHSLYLSDISKWKRETTSPQKKMWMPSCKTILSNWFYKVYELLITSCKFKCIFLNLKVLFQT